MRRGGTLASLAASPEAPNLLILLWRRGESNRAGEDEEGEEGSIGGTLKMSRLPTSPVPTHHVVPEGRHTGARHSQIVTGVPPCSCVVPERQPSVLP